MFETWPEDSGVARDILKAEQEGDRITQDIVRRLNLDPPKGLDSADIYAPRHPARRHRRRHRGGRRLHGPLRDRGADGAGPRPLQVLAQSCEQVSGLLNDLRGFKDLERYWVEIHRLENEGDRVWREALASLFSNGIDPMVVIRWKDIFGLLERAIDSTETAAHKIEAIAVKHS